MRNTDLYEFAGDIAEGVFSWESVWPEFGATNVGDASKDLTAMAAASGFPPFFSHSSIHLVTIFPNIKY